MERNAYSGLLVPTRRRTYATVDRDGKTRYTASRPAAYRIMVDAMESRMPDNFAMGAVHTIPRGSYGESSTITYYVLEGGKVEKASTYRYQ